MMTTIKVNSTHCLSRKALIEDICNDGVPVKSCSVDWQTGQVVVDHQDNIDWQGLKSEIEGVGEYNVVLNN